jgi:hypothetical protein
MADASVRRRGHDEDAIYFAAEKNRYVGAVLVGFGPDGKRLRRKVTGKTKQEVQDKLRALHAELNVGLSRRRDTRSGRRWRTSWSTGCRAGRRGRCSCTGTA